ncbi:unnamed protein product, partial [Medioppia subpectinata]
CGITLVTTVIIMALVIPALNMLNSYYYNYASETITAAKAIIITVGVVCIINQCLGVFAGYKEHFQLALGYGVVSILLTVLCFVGGILIGGIGYWYLMIQFAVCAGLGFQFTREIRRCDLNANLGHQAVYVNTGLQPNVVYQVPPQPNYVMAAPVQQTGAVYITPTLTASQTMHASGGQMIITTPTYGPTSQMVAYPNPNPGPSYVDPIHTPPTYTQSQEDLRMSQGGLAFRPDHLNEHK